MREPLKTTPSFNSSRSAKRWAVALLISVEMIFAPTAFAQGPQCEGILGDEPVVEVPVYTSEKEVKKATKEIFKNETEKYTKWSRLAVIQLTKMSINKKVRELCRAPDFCSEAEIANIVQSSIATSFEKYDNFKLNSRRVRGYSILVGSMVAIAVGSHQLKGMLPEHDQWLGDFITIASSIGLYKLGAPLWDYLGGIAYRGAFRMQDGKSFFRDSKEDAIYQDNYRLLQEKMTPMQQLETARVNNLLGSVESTFSAAIESIQSRDPSKGGIERASARLANMAIKIRKFFPEISSEDEDLNRTVKLLFTQFLVDKKEKEQLYDLTLRQIEAADADAFQDSETAEIYKRVIRYWTGLEEVPVK